MGRTRGFAFANFLSPQDAKDFALAACGRPLRHPSALKPLAVVPADIQGFDRIVEQTTGAEAIARGATAEPIILRGSEVQVLSGASAAVAEAAAQLVRIVVRIVVRFCQ